MPLLMYIFLIPFVCSAILLTVPAFSKVFLKSCAMVMSLIPLGILLFGHSNLLGSVVKYPWIPAISIDFYLKVDALSLLFLYLTSIIVPLSIYSVKDREISGEKFLYSLILALQGLLIGFFTAQDLALFTLLWESMLLPLYFIISFWGGTHRQEAALKFLIYMIAGSALLIAAVLSLYLSVQSMNGVGTFSFEVLSAMSESMPWSSIVCAVFLLAFAVKTPMFPFHAWLPDAYYQAPVAGTILLSALLSKAGIYGFLRIGLEFFPTHIMEWSPLLLSLSIAGVFFGGLSAWMQTDFKRLIAYSSLSHVNFILVGIFVWNDPAHSGAILQALNHGVTITALFLVAGWLQDRLGNTSMLKVSGLAKYMPWLCWFTLFFVLSSVALPGLNNFVGELLIFFGVFKDNPWIAALLGLSVILSVIYMLKWMQQIYFGVPSDYQISWIDLKGKDVVVALSLVILVLWVGIYPATILQYVEVAAQR